MHYHGSAALDMARDESLPLPPKIQCPKMTTGVYGILLAGTVGIILGRRALISQGSTVHPGIIDDDFIEEIKIMAYVKRDGI